MEKIVSRPKNSELGKESRDERIPVQVSSTEKKEIEEAAAKDGMGASTWIRFLALREAREDG